MTVGLYNLNPTKVNQELAAMRAAGATDIVLPIWMANFNSVDGDGIVDWVNAYLIDYGTGNLRPQHRQNVISLMQSIKSHGFKRVFVRFFGYFNNWDAWDENEYQKIWNYVVNTRNLVDTQLQGSSVSVLYDLAGEGAAIDTPSGVRKQFIKRLWTDYTYVYGATKTVGFSYAWAPGRFTTMEQWYAECGTARPEIYAFDIYPTTTTQALSSIQSIYDEMGDQNGKPVIISETWFNDADTASGISSALSNSSSLYNLNLDGLFQWQLIKSRSMQNLDMNWSHDAITAMSSNSQLSQYRPLLATRRINITNTRSSVFVLADSSCGTTSSASCTVNEKWAAPPAGKTVVISSSSDGNPEVLHACSTTAGSQSIPWITPGHSYRFVVRHLSSCALSSATPNSESTISTLTSLQP